MKFYDLEWLATKCGTDNKYEITAKIAAEARRESEEFPAKEKDPSSIFNSVKGFFDRQLMVYTKF